MVIGIYCSLKTQSIFVNCRLAFKTDNGVGLNIYHN